MKMKSFKKLLTLIVMAFLAMIVVACGNDSSTEPKDETQTGSENATSELEGSVVIDGSGTVFPFMSKMAENYMTTEQENVSVEVSRAGTSAGFKKFLVEDGTDFNDASRQIKDEEAATAKELGIEVKELKVALDGLTFVVHPDNDWANELTQQEVIDIFLASAGKKNWSDIRADFPNEPIQTY